MNADIDKVLSNIRQEADHFRRGRPVRILFMVLTCGISLMWADWRFVAAIFAVLVTIESATDRLIAFGASLAARGHARATPCLFNSMAFVATAANTIAPAYGFLSGTTAGMHLAEMIFAVMIVISGVYLSNDRSRLIAATAPVLILMAVLPFVKFGFSGEAFAYVLIYAFFVATAASSAADRNKLLAAVAGQEQARNTEREASAAKFQFIANVSHELRTPLNAIIGYSEIMQESAREDARTGDVEDHDRVLGASRNLLALINQVLDLTQAPANLATEDRRDYCPASLARAAASNIMPAASANGVRVSVRCSDALGRGLGDEVKVAQCLANLTSNAAKFTKAGWIDIAASREHAHGRDWLVFVVEDTGPGVDAQKAAQVFEPFMQVDGSLTRGEGGLGLGLSVSRLYARAMGGEVTFESELGKGTRVTLRVPVQSASALPNGARPALAA